MNPCSFTTTTFNAALSGIGDGWVVSVFLLGSNGRPDYARGLVFCDSYRDISEALRVYSERCAVPPDAYREMRERMLVLPAGKFATAATSTSTARARTAAKIQRGRLS